MSVILFGILPRKRFARVASCRAAPAASRSSRAVGATLFPSRVAEAGGNVCRASRRRERSPRRRHWSRPRPAASGVLQQGTDAASASTLTGLRFSHHDHPTAPSSIVHALILMLFRVESHRASILSFTEEKFLPAVALGKVVASDASRLGSGGRRP